MEVMEIMTAAVRDVWYVARFYPVTTVFGAIIALMLLIRLYCSLTVGMCDCTTDMTGRTVIITGANTGIGKVTATEMAKRGARVILACRNRERGQKALEEVVQETGSYNVVLKDLDLCSFASVRAFAKDILKTEKNLHVLINNAGLVGANQLELTEDDCEKSMQANHLGHFLLTVMLLDLLKKSSPSRIINVSSDAHRYARLRLNDLNNKDRKYDSFAAYNNTKMANVLFTRELSRRLKGTGVTANSLHPGVVRTDFLRPEISGIKRVVLTIFMIFAKTTVEGAQTTIHLALSPHLENVTGKYFMDCKIKKESSWSRSDERASHLWRVSEDLVGLNSTSKKS